MNNETRCQDCGAENGEPHRDKCRCLEFPGWTPESGETKYGYPLPTSMQSLSADEVRQWGKKALDVLAQLLEINRGDITEDTDWIIDARCWAESVLGEVEKAIGPHDSVLHEYAATAETQFDQVDSLDIAIDLEGMERRNYSHARGEYGEDHTVEDDNDRDFPGTPDRDWVGEENDNPEGAFEQNSISVPDQKCPDHEGMDRSRSVKGVNMSPSDDKVFVNSSKEEHREAIRSATYLLGAFGGLDNAREYLSQVSESLGHIPPRMPEGRQQWVALTREQFAADREEMFRRCTRMKGEGNAD